MKRHIFLALTLLVLSGSVYAQGTQAPEVTSPEVSEDQIITFSIFAPNADTVLLSGSDLPGMIDNKMERAENGVWKKTIGPVPAGAYRYNFNVDGLSVIDPVNPATSESNANTWSLVNVQGNPDMDTRDVPHGAISEITYYSDYLKKFRRMHIYTPPGYESDSDTEYPVFYLLHGALDSDDSWSTVGRAGFIFDNLIADEKANPMIVVMPDGHTERYRWGGSLNLEEFTMDFNTEVKPYVESNYRVKTDRANTAMAGLSMGGAHTLEITIPDLEEYAYIGVYSSGVFGINGGDQRGRQGPFYTEKYAEVLNNDALKENLELFWFATGTDDFLLEITRGTVKMFEEHGFDVTYNETGGGHTWLNWRDYLIEFTPMLFK